MNDNNMCQTLVRGKIIGNKISSPYFIISPDGFKTGTVGRIKVNATDVGQVVGFMLDKEEINAACSMSFIQLTYYDNNEGKLLTYKWDLRELPLLANQFLKFPYKEVIVIDINPEIMTEGKLELENSIDPEFLPFQELPEFESLDVMSITEDDIHKSFNGSACLSHVENTNIVDIQCETTVKDILSSFQIYNSTEIFEYPNIYNK